MGPNESSADAWIVDAARGLVENVDDTRVGDHLRTRLPGVIRRGRPVATGIAGIEVNTRALQQLVARALVEECDREVAAVRTVTEGSQLRHVHVDLVARYGDNLREVAQHANDVAHRTLRWLLATDGSKEYDVRIRWTDLTS